MNLITALFLMILTGHNTSAQHLQKLYCPYESSNRTQTRIWCKRDAQDENCCTGFSFSPGVSNLEQGNVEVQDDGKSFTVSVLKLTQGEGVYWCGLMAEDKTIVKLSEDYFSTNPLNFVWSILRWIIFLLLPLMSISTCIYVKRTDGNEKTQENIEMDERYTN